MRLCRTAPIVATGVAVLLTAGCATSTHQAGGRGGPAAKLAAAPALRVVAKQLPAEPNGSPVTPIIMSSIGEPLAVAGSDGKQHIEYDLLVTNTFTAPVTLTSVDVRTQSGASVFRVTGAALAAVTQGNFYQRPVDPAAQIPVSAQVSVEIDVTLPAHARLPRRLDQVIGWRVPANAPALALLNGKTTGRIAGLPLRVSRVKPEVIAAPLRGRGWMSLQGCCRPNGHRSLRVPVFGRREVKAEMFAIDWVQLTHGSYFSGDGSRNSDFHYIGADELAVANGTVVRTRDGMANETPGEPPAHVKLAKDYIGNSVVIKFGPDRYAVYGHMLAGSIRVKVGDRVKTGQVLGKLGNSGNSTAAHLHFVITDRPDFLSAKSLPFVINRWTLQGNAVIPDDPGPIVVRGPAVAQKRTHPLYLSVANFA